MEIGCVVQRLGEKSDKLKALCCVCDCVIDITTMGESALKSHMKAEKQSQHPTVTNKIYDDN